MGSFSRDEVEAAFRHYWQVGAIDERWDAWADLLTEDVEYVEHVYGTMQGRETVRTWITRLMAENPHVHAVLDWVMIEGDRVVLNMQNRYYNPEPGGEPLDFPGLTILTYAGDGLWKRQEDYWCVRGAKEAYIAFQSAAKRFGTGAIEETDARRKARTPW